MGTQEKLEEARAEKLLDLFQKMIDEMIGPGKWGVILFREPGWRKGKVVRLVRKGGRS